MFWGESDHLELAGVAWDQKHLKKSDSISNKVDDCSHNRRSISRKPILH